MEWSHKLTAIATAVPFGLFVFYSQTDYRKLYYENETNKVKIAELTANSSEIKFAEAMSCYNDAKKFRDESEEVYIIAQRNNEYRNKLLEELQVRTANAKKYMNAYNKRDSYFEVEAFMAVLPKKNSELYETIEKVKRLPLNTLNNDIQMKKSLEDAMTIHKYIKNNL